MNTKLIEIRDSATFIPAMIIQMSADNDEQHYLLGRSGYGGGRDYVLMLHLNHNIANYDPYSWGNRTMFEAHKYCLENFNNIKDGEVIDVQFILGETQFKKESEQYTAF